MEWVQSKLIESCYTFLGLLFINLLLLKIIFLEVVITIVAFFNTTFQLYSLGDFALSSKISVTSVAMNNELN